jgi:hypothetical protein
MADWSSYRCMECGELYKECDCCTIDPIRITVDETVVDVGPVCGVCCRQPCGCPDRLPTFPEDPVVETILQRIHQRAKKGMTDYGISMEKDVRPVRTWIDEAQTELMDAVLYLEKLKRTL